MLSKEDGEALKYRREAVDLLYDALRFHEGSLDQKQQEVIRGILDNLIYLPIRFSLEIVKNIDRCLANAGLHTIPSGE